MTHSEFALQTRPELQAGGFGRDDGSLAFYQRIDSLLHPDMTVLDLGAGRGAQFIASEGKYLRRVMPARGRVAKFVGVDVDPVVTTNPSLDEAFVVDPSEPLPFEDASFDLIYSDWVLEHVEYPDSFVGEVSRVLKPGGWFCARTPGKWSYIAVASRMVPEKLQQKAINAVQEDRQEQDVFPKFYRMNTLGTLTALFPKDRFVHAIYPHNPGPAYHGDRAWLFKLFDAYQNLPGTMFKTTLHVFVQKRA